MTIFNIYTIADYSDMDSPVFRVIIFLYTLSSILTCKAEVFKKQASGSDVVERVVASVEKIFPSKNILRRIAFVESKDGTDKRTYRDGYHGGIWQVDVEGFRDTQDTVSHPALKDKFKRIKKEFGIDWPQVQWEDLRNPLYSGLAARLKLSNVKAEIPSSDNLEAQGKYWKQHYNSNSKRAAGEAWKFVEDIKSLESKRESKSKLF